MGALPVCHFTIDDMIAEGDQVVTKKTFEGTHAWLTMDQLRFMHQLGVLTS